MLHGYDWSGFLTGGHKTLAGAANHVLGLKAEGRGVTSSIRSCAMRRCLSSVWAAAALALSGSLQNLPPYSQKAVIARATHRPQVGRAERESSFWFR